MSALTKTCATFCMILLPWTSMALDDAAAEAVPAAEAQTEEAQAETAKPSGVDTSLPLGKPETGGVGSTYVAQEFSAWELRCIRTESGNDPCQLYQLLKDNNDNAVSEITLFTVEGGGDAVGGATVITPLETLLTASLRLAVDGGNAKVYPYSFCSRKGCVARLGLTEEDLNALRKGISAIVAIVPAAAPKERVDLTVSLAGFTAGWNALVAANKAARDG